MANVQNNHGGGCCGMYHIHGFSPSRQKADLVDVKEALNRASNKAADNEKAGRLCEIVLTDGQLANMPTLVKGLKELGFKLKSRFLNRNSDNYCNVLHWTPTNELHGSPYWKK